MTMTFSSGIPVLYLAAAIHFFFAFWTDKFLLLRYYRLTPGYTKRLSARVVMLLPLAVLLHFLFGVVVFSNPSILISEILSGYFGNNSKYYNSDRVGQIHVVIFVWSCVGIFLIILLQTQLAQLISAIFSCCKSNDPSSPRLSDDLFKELSYDQLYHEYRKLQIER